MGLRAWMSLVTVGMGLIVFVPVGWAADGESTAEAAAVEGVGVTLEQLREAIEAEPDLELRDVMREELETLESQGIELPTGERTFGDAGGGEVGGDQYLPPEARAELHQLFQQGTGDPAKDGHLREQADKILEKYGIDHEQFGDLKEGGEYQGTSPREAFEQWERSEEGRLSDPAAVERYREMSEQSQAEFERGEGFERAMTEHMAPEAREQMERLFSEQGEREIQEHEMFRESMEREFGEPSSERSYETPAREYEATTREYEAPTREYEAPTHEYEAPTHEYEAPEAPTHEYEAPTHEYEAPQHDSPSHEGQMAY